MREDLEIKLDGFFQELFPALEQSNLNINDYFMDHICFRVPASADYESYKSIFSSMGSLLIESEVGGRQISTYKLTEPFKYKMLSIDVVELPQPKSDNKYALGFEHAEFVIDQSFDDFAKQHSHLQFDWAGATKLSNPELRYKIHQNLSVKFHHQSLEDVIKEEIRAK